MSAKKTRLQKFREFYLAIKTEYLENPEDIVTKVIACLEKINAKENHMGKFNLAPLIFSGRSGMQHAVYIELTVG